MLISFELRIGGAVGTVSLCVPYLVLEPAMDKLTARGYFSTQSDTLHAREPRQRGDADRLGAWCRWRSSSAAAELSVERAARAGARRRHPARHRRRRGRHPPGRHAARAFLAQPGVRGRRVAVQITSPIEESERTYA